MNTYGYWGHPWGSNLTLNLYFHLPRKGSEPWNHPPHSSALSSHITPYSLTLKDSGMLFSKDSYRSCSFWGSLITNILCSTSASFPQEDDLRNKHTNKNTWKDVTGRRSHLGHRTLPEVKDLRNCLVQIFHFTWETKAQSCNWTSGLLGDFSTIPR